MYVLRYNPATDKCHESWVVARTEPGIWEALADGPTANAALANLTDTHGLSLQRAAEGASYAELRLGGVRAEVEMVPA